MSAWKAINIFEKSRNETMSVGGVHYVQRQSNANKRGYGNGTTS